MALVLAWLGLLFWSWKIDRRVRAQLAVGREAAVTKADKDKVRRVLTPAGPEERRKREEVERAARESDPDYGRVMRLGAVVRTALAWVLALWALCLVVHVRAAAEQDAAREAMATCRAWLEGEALQACVAPAQELYLDSAGTAATSEVVLWVIGVL